MNTEQAIDRILLHNIHLCLFIKYLNSEYWINFPIIFSYIDGILLMLHALLAVRLHTQRPHAVRIK